MGGDPQGSILGQILFILGSNDAAEEVDEEDKFKYIDDLATTEIVQTENKFQDYVVWQHVPSDVATGQKCLPPDTFKTQTRNEDLSKWTTDNKMKLNEGKSKYMVFNNSKEKFATRITINNKFIERTNQMLHLGVWISEDLKWNRHISEICRKAYPRIRMLTKLKYV